MATHAQQRDQTELVQTDARTVLAGEDFDWLLRMLDEPDEPVPALVRAVERERERQAPERA